MSNTAGTDVLDLAESFSSSFKAVGKKNSFRPSRGEIFEKTETVLEGEKRRVTYILQTSGAHDQR